MDLAEKDYCEAIQLDQELEAAYMGRASTRALSNNFDGAIEDLNAVININPDNRSAFAARGIAIWTMGDE